MILPEPDNILGSNDTSFKYASHARITLPDNLEGWSLPGHGSHGKDCGNSLLMTCNDCGHVFVGTKHCHQKTCPDCWRTWAYLSGRRAGLRTWAGKKIVFGKWKGRLLHIVVSYPYVGGDPNRYRKDCYKTCIEHGIEGGAVVMHHMRTDDDHNRVPDGYIHFHVIGLARGHVKPAEGSNPIFKVIRDSRHKDYRGFQSAREVIDCITYILRHASVKEGPSHTLTYFGSISYNKLSDKDLEEKVPGLMEYLNKRLGSPCERCGSRDTTSLWDLEIELYRQYMADLWHNQVLERQHDLALAIEEGRTWF